MTMAGHDMKTMPIRKALTLLLIMVLPRSASAEPLLRPLTMDTISSFFRTANLRLLNLGSALMQGPVEGVQIWHNLTTFMASREGIVTLAYALIVGMIGTGAEWFYWTYAAPARRAIDAMDIRNPRLGRRLAFRRTALFLCGFLLFSVATLGSLAFFDWPEGAEHLVLAPIMIILLTRFMWIVADSLFAPGHHQRRLLDVGPAEARIWVTVIVGLTILVGGATIYAPLIQQAGSANAAEALQTVSVTLSAILIIVAVSASRKHRDSTQARTMPRSTLPVPFLRIAIIIAIYGLWLFSGDVIATLAVIIVLAVSSQLHLHRAVMFLWSDEPDHDLMEPHAHGQEIGTAQVDSLAPSIILTLARYVFVIIAIIAAILALDIPMMEMATSSNPLRQFIVRLSEIALIALISHIVWLAVRLPIDHRLQKLIATSDPHGSVNANARLLTLLPLMRTTGGVILLAFFVISSLWSLGIDIGPLLAGAGVFGLALGFGAQALVRDVISGIFYLVEDVFRIGEYIEAGTHAKGTVERITLRTVALRHQNGPLYFVPYGSLGSIKNNSRDWSIDKFNIPLPVTTDSEQVRKIIKKVGEQMMQDPEIGSKIVEPLKSKVYGIEPGIKIFRCKFRCAPGNQFEIRVQAYKRIEAALRDAGIPFAAGTQVLMPLPPHGQMPTTTSTPAEASPSTP
ncbi:small-conductance mechanosensitive channel [Agrobacterium vitis]|nr:small-conductance mechanosensitive channel [Agrobacterium vitis]